MIQFGEGRVVADKFGNDFLGFPDGGFRLAMAGELFQFIVIRQQVLECVDAGIRNPDFLVGSGVSVFDGA